MPVIEEKPQDEKLFRIRHSLAHVMAQAVQTLYPGTKLGFGPAIDDGFYYDFILPKPLSDAELPAIEGKMREIIAAAQTFSHEDLPLDAALTRIEGQMGEPFKAEYARELANKKGHREISFYTNGGFVDMCEGPHVSKTSDIPADAFKLHSLAGAYWRGDERNAMMTRIYGYAFNTKAELDEYVTAVEQARQRDHRKLGAELRIYAIRDEIGKGLPLWLPNGAAIRHELEKLAHEMEFRAGYKKVATPHITKRGIYETSGHIPLYEDGMYPPMVLEEEGRGAGGPEEAYYLKPMNCPHHHMVFASEKHSYRDLPLRYTEYGSVYRFERAGALQGLTRVRGMTMNDAHIYVTPEQLKEEFQAVMQLHERYYSLFGLTNYFMRLSLWDPADPKRGSKYVDDPENWALSERLVTEALEEMGANYKLSPGEAAFYGPKVDFQFVTVTGREFTLSTNQLDFAVPSRFGLAYTDKDGKEKTPYCIHRAPMGTHERFIAFLIEHFGGAFPTWLAPVQVVIIPVSDKFLAYGKKIEALLREDLVRVELDTSSATMGKKIQEGATRKVPILLVVGGKEETEQTVTVRRYGIKEQKAMPLAGFVEMLSQEIKERRHVKSW
ncbi:threonine--tRNA ligase [Polyangium jinanense]|uniref:Threonine--tRNA ligase n=1 Tax=Polyangium jinanense TaxID=2829994 RepID=A0A9X3X0B3_9BACT|nr:threonine--tRNA ligase [Polyangium jinanense]MDC3952592.1 threonine--tRNA ligase [Polyangium jinanense]MDC3980220.1 threonine--tRNA ligase [Polyangium jinanense]